MIVIAWASLTGAAPGLALTSYADVSLTSVLESPSAYAGCPVRVRGFIVLEREGRALWATEADFLAQRHQRAVWLDTPAGMEAVEAVNGKRGFVSGVVAWHDKGAGAYGLYGAEITQISMITPDPSDTDRPRPWLNDPLFVILAALGAAGACIR